MCKRNIFFPHFITVLKARKKNIQVATNLEKGWGVGGLSGPAKKKIMRLPLLVNF